MEDCLGFEVVERGERYVPCQRDAVFVRRIDASPDPDIDDPAQELMRYIDLDDVDAFYGTRGPVLNALAEGQYRAPFDQSFRQREMHVIHGPFLFIMGHPIEGNRA